MEITQLEVVALFAINATLVWIAVDISDLVVVLKDILREMKKTKKKEE